MFGRGNAAETGPMFGDYDIIETVGQGGMGIVYRAHDVTLGRIVALKVLKDDLRQNRRITARFQREAEAFATLNHPNIVHIYSVGSIGKIPYISMEFIEGEALNATMKREKRIPWKRSLYIAEQIARALGCAHEAHIIHRDIKPGNILIDKQDRAYVTDFGIAKVLTAETQLTLDGARLGTPQYMSPERCVNQEAVAESDIYSLGVLLFQMITGRLPYEASSPVDLLRKIVSDPPKRISDYLKGVPEDIDRLVAFMLEKKPSHRPSSASDWADLAERVREGKPLFDDKGMAAAFQDLREPTSTPLTPIPLGPPTTRFDPRQAIVRWWNAVPPTLRMSLLTAVLVGLSAFAGFALTRQMNSDKAPGALREPRADMTPWYQGPDVADFNPETDTLLLAHVNLNGLTVESVHFGPGGLVFAQLQGKSKGPRQGQSFLCALDPVAREATLLLTPVVLPFSEGPFSLVDVLPANARTPETRLLLRRERPHAANGLETVLYQALLSGGATREPEAFLHASRIAVPGLTGAHSIGPLAVAPSGEAMAFALGASDDPKSWALLYRGTAKDARPIPLTPQGSPIETVQFTRDGTVIVYDRVLGPGRRQIWSTEAAGAPDSGSLIDEGAITFAPGALHPLGRHLLVTRMNEPAGESELQVYDLQSRTVVAELGSGLVGTWSPSGDRVFAAVPDRKGHTQWTAIQAREPYGRAQLTFLENGAEPMCRVAPDGTWLVSVARDGGRPTLVFADLR